jgi:hypothetical protein
MAKKEKHSSTHSAHSTHAHTTHPHHSHEHKQHEHPTHHAPQHVTHVTHVHPTATVDHSKTLEEKLVHNLVELQKVHADLAEKFTKLSDQIAGLLRLFELSAQAFAKQVNLPNVQKDSEFLDKIDKLLDQNKTIAKGLMLMEEKIRGRIGQPDQPTMQPMQFQQRSDVPRPLPRF